MTILLLIVLVIAIALIVRDIIWTTPFEQKYNDLVERTRETRRALDAIALRIEALEMSRFRLFAHPNAMTRLPSWPDGSEVVQPYLEVDEYFGGHYRIYPAGLTLFCQRCEQSLGGEAAIHSLQGVYCPNCGLSEMIVEWSKEYPDA